MQGMALRTILRVSRLFPFRTRVSILSFVTCDGDILDPGVPATD